MDQEDTSADTLNSPAFFSAEEARVAACLMEKELITPDNYPLTIHSLTLACDQKSSREPVMNLTEGQVGHVVNQLAERGLVHVDYGGRSPRVSHRINLRLHLNRDQQAVLAVLMLRRPQTLNDIKTRTERMARFEDLDRLSTVIEDLIQRDPPLAAHLPKGQGQREDRYTHLLCGEETAAPVAPPSARPAGPGASRDERLATLENRVEALEARLEAMLARFEIGD